jgi:hypothetical protein
MHAFLKLICGGIVTWSLLCETFHLWVLPDIHHIAILSDYWTKLYGALD